MTENSATGSHPDVWVLTDDRPGTANQALGVADALALPYSVKTLSYGPMAGLPNPLLGSSFLGLKAGTKSSLAAPWPALVIAAGRRAGVIARAIKSRSGGSSKIVQVMDPGAWGRAAHDLIAVPEHDGLPARPNLLPIAGAPHRLTEAVLVEAGKNWSAGFVEFKRPLIAVLVGGGYQGGNFDAPKAEGLGRQAGAYAKSQNGSLLLIGSPRTGELLANVEAGLVAEDILPALSYAWRAETENPYLAILSLADELIVSGDTVTMCCEACFTGKPVWIFSPDGLAGPKHSRFHRGLYERGYAAPLGGEASQSAAPLNEAARIARKIRELMNW
ncbi:MAG: mitochondrial fission ELM1 family protein [Rhodospirillaceae bacterium]